VLGSHDKLKQVFLNLIINARDAMPDGGALTVRLHQANGMVHVSVADTGVGIPPENLGKIFDAFFTTKKEVSGVGLGLAVSYGIVQQHNGSITVSSTPGKGTTFRVSLPLYQNSDAATGTN
jgi:signal transduction histidine kinase